tara:strand:- start:3237 stop:3974 length:738 start_codon:yes stop_codon:yes gene_type:complete
MNYLNIHTDLLRSESYLGAEPVERATWINLLAWCATQENGGIIHDAAEWSDRKWQQVCGITKEEAYLDSKLYHIRESDGMTVNHYPKDKEEEVKTNRLNGKKGGRPKGVKAKKNQVVNPDETTCPEIAETEGERERKDKENGIEGEENSCPSPDEKTILALIWGMAPSKAKSRSSKKQVAAEWKKIKAADRPSEDDLALSFTAWTKSDDWTKDRGEFVPGLHLWFKNRKWEDAPEPAKTKIGSCL